MKIGKIPEATLKKVILEQLGAKRDEVLISTGIGEDCAALKLKKERYSYSPPTRSQERPRSGQAGSAYHRQ